MAGVAVTVGGNFSKLDELGKKALSVSKTIKAGFQLRVGQKMFDSLISAAQRIPELMEKSIKAASDLNEVVSKTGEVFQQSSQDMLDWAENSATAFGQSRSAALAAAADYGNLFRAMDIAPEKAGEMSRAMVELATDLASFNNTSVEDAVTAIGSALRGEAEPIRRYGVLLNDATLKAEAMAQGLSDGKATLDPATKAMAAYSLVLAQTGTAHGDFARTSDGAANSTKIITAQLADMSAQIGTELLPVVEDFAKVLKGVDWEVVGGGIADVIAVAKKTAPAIFGPLGLLAAPKIGKFLATMNAVEESLKRGSAALKRFNAETLKGQLTSPAAVAKKIAELEKTKQEIREATTQSISDAGDNAGLAQRLRADMEITMRQLDQQRDRLQAISEEQIEAAKAKEDAAIAEMKLAAAIKETAKNYEDAKKKFNDAIAAGDKATFDSSPIDEQIRLLNEAEAKIRDGFNSAIKTNFGDADAAALAKVFQQYPERAGADKDLAAAAELLKIEQQRAALQAESAKKIAEQTAERDALVTQYNEELSLINAELDGNVEKLNLLRQEITVREKIAALVKAGVSPDDARRRAEQFGAAQFRLAEKNRTAPGREAASDAGDDARKALAGKEGALGIRIAELMEKGLSKGEASKTADLESLTEKRSDLASRVDGAKDNQSIVTGSQGRIGGGGGVYVAGLDYQRQLASLSREQLTVSKQIVALLANNRIFD